jgi:hypothetical protein
MEKNLHELQDQLGGPRNNNHKDQNEIKNLWAMKLDYKD